MSKQIQLTPFARECDRTALEKIARWRNRSLISLRSIKPTYPELQIFWYEKVIRDNSVRYFYIHRNSELIGYCGLDKILETNKTAEIGLLINPDMHKKGYGSTALKELLKIAFCKLCLNCVSAEVYTTTSNWEFWQKCGFIQEGLLRQRKYWDGKYYNSIAASILKQEWSKNEKFFI